MNLIFEIKICADFMASKTCIHSVFVSDQGAQLSCHAALKFWSETQVTGRPILQNDYMDFPGEQKQISIHSSSQR